MKYNTVLSFTDVNMNIEMAFMSNILSSARMGCV